MKSTARLKNDSSLKLVSLGALLNSLPDGAYVTDTNRKILLWNRAAEKITGWQAEEVVGKSCYDNVLIHIDKDGNNLCSMETCPLHRCIVTKQPNEQPMLVFAQSKYDRRIPVEASVSPLTNDKGEVVGGIHVFRDLRLSMNDLARAKKIQEDALLSQLPSDYRVEFEVEYHARDIVGGDFYHIERISANRYVIFVADAIGHGLAAVLYTMQLRSVLDDHFEILQHSLPQFMQSLNHRLHVLAHDAGFFATAACVVYDTTCGHIRCVRAGHLAPLIFREDNRTDIIGQPQTALGMLAETHYTETHEQLNPGDTLLMFTDGATEIFDAQEQELEVAGLRQLVREEMTPQGELRLKSLGSRLIQFNNHQRLPDDLTIVKMRRLL